MLDINVRAVLNCADAALPHLLRAAQDSPREVADMVNISSVAGRVVRRGSAVYNLTKHGVGAFSESLRQEVAERHVRVALVEPGATATELSSHNRPEIREGIQQRFAGMQRLEADRRRRDDPLHRHASLARGDQRGADPPDRTGGLTLRRAGSAFPYRARHRSTSSPARPPCRSARARAAAS